MLAAARHNPIIAGLRPPPGGLGLGREAGAGLEIPPEPDFAALDEERATRWG